MTDTLSVSDEITAEPAHAPTPPPAAADPFALAPVSPDNPCGPDLDLEGDAEFLNFFAATEGLLPAQFYSFNRESIDFPAAFQATDKLIKRTLDIRLIALAAKLSILSRRRFFCALDRGHRLALARALGR